MEGLEPTHLAAPDPKSGTSTNFATSANATIFYRGSAKVSLIDVNDKYFYQLRWL